MKLLSEWYSIATSLRMIILILLLAVKDILPCT